MEIMFVVLTVEAFLCVFYYFNFNSCHFIGGRVEGPLLRNEGLIRDKEQLEFYCNFYYLHK